MRSGEILARRWARPDFPESAAGGGNPVRSRRKGIPLANRLDGMAVNGGLNLARLDSD